VLFPPKNHELRQHFTPVIIFARTAKLALNFFLFFFSLKGGRPFSFKKIIIKQTDFDHRRGNQKIMLGFFFFQHVFI